MMSPVLAGWLADDLAVVVWWQIVNNMRNKYLIGLAWICTLKCKMLGLKAGQVVSFEMSYLLCQEWNGLLVEVIYFVIPRAKL